MGGKVSVFLSYRRADAPYAAGRLGDRLGERFELFMDIDIAPGLHFGHALTDAVSSCDVMLVLIGRSWLNAMDDDGQRRLEDPRDWVVQEIEAALARDVTVIPVLVDGARMPLPRPSCPRSWSRSASARRSACGTSRSPPTYGILMTAIEQAVPTGPEATTARPGPQRRAAPGERLAPAARGAGGGGDRKPGRRSRPEPPPRRQPSPSRRPARPGAADHHRGELPHPGGLVAALYTSVDDLEDSLSAVGHHDRGHPGLLVVMGRAPPAAIPTGDTCGSSTGLYAAGRRAGRAGAGGGHQERLQWTSTRSSGCCSTPWR